jgi:hypothetical protein
MGSTQRVAIVLVAVLAACSGGSSSSVNELARGICADKCIKACNADSDCDLASGELCCDYGGDGKACSSAKDCPRQCTADNTCDTAHGEACVRETLATPLLVCDQPQDGLRLCQADKDCVTAGDVCCKAYNEPLCLPANRCPKTCTNSNTCNTALGEICCTSMPVVDPTLVAGGICISPSNVACPKTCAKSTDCNTAGGEICCNGLCSTSCVQSCSTSADCTAQVCCKTRAAQSPFVHKARKPGYVVTVPPATGAGGTGGNSGGGGAGGASGGGRAILPNNGYVSSASNAVGIQGYFYTFSDGFGTIAPDSFAAAGSQICVSGATAAVVGGDYATYYGSGIGVNLNQGPDPGAAVGAFDPTAHGVTGFAFTIAGATIPTTLSVSLKVVGSSAFYCKVATGGANSVRAGDLRADCTSPTPGAGPPAGATIEALQWHIGGMAAPVQFDFCITNISALGN